MCNFLIVEDSVQVSDFEKWRFAPYDKNLLFNFKNTVASEDQATTLIVTYYGETIGGFRRLISNHVPDKNWIIMETCFLTESARLHALTHGLRTNNGIKILPLTTSTETVKYTCLTFGGAALLPKHSQVKSHLLQLSKSIIDDINSSLSGNVRISVTIDDVLNVWMGTDSGGFYRGCGGVIFQGYDSRFTLVGKTISSLLDYDQAQCYASISVSIKPGYMYCTKCHTLNRHETADCMINSMDCTKNIDSGLNTTKEPVKCEDNTIANQGVQKYYKGCFDNTKEKLAKCQKLKDLKEDGSDGNQCIVIIIDDD